MTLSGASFSFSRPASREFGERRPENRYYGRMHVIDDRDG